MKLIVAASLKEKVILCALMGLVLWFFAIPVVAYCIYDCKVFIPLKTASLLLFFFR